jgi:CHAT domain-containing protein
MPAQKSTARSRRVAKKARRRPERPSRPAPPVDTVEHGRRAAWGVMVYLAGDTPWGYDALRADLDEILQTGGSSDLTLVVQHDGPDGAARYIVPPHGSAHLTPTKRFTRIDSGGTAALLDFVRWGMTVCRSDRLALVLGSPYTVSPGEGADSDRTNVLALAYDHGSGNLLKVSELAGVIREALSDADREQIDLLAIDSCYVQFLELAYELEDSVRILVAPQTTIPVAGWDYVRVLSLWKTLAATPSLGTPQVAKALLDMIVQCYSDAEGTMRAVSALDLQRLDDVANAFDTLCIGSMQVLGEGLIWRARDLLLKELHETTSGPVYDCGSFFAIWSASLDAFADEAYQGWLGSTIAKASGNRLDRFFEAVIRNLENDAVGVGAVDEVGIAVNERLSLLIAALRAVDRKTAGEHFLTEVSAGLKARIQQLQPGARSEVRERAAKIAVSCDRAVMEAVNKSTRLLPEERRFDLKRMEEAARNAERLARQADQAGRALMGDGEVPGMVIGVQSAPSVSTGWPRWSGVSMYRPSKLDDLMSDSYQQFAFHRRVHWAALLGAANLIEDHPRALWRLISSLLATGSAGTRRDVLRRLTGNDSVVWGLRQQFQVMAPAPTVTLSLERRNDPLSDSSKAGGKSERYLLRLESSNRGAVVTEQDSRVQRDVMDRALNGLNLLLQRDVVTTQSLNDLRAIGGLLGEDIFQTLGRVLDEERKSVQDESPDAMPHLQLQIPLELMKFPWELLHHHGEWLGERYAMGRQVFMETGLARRVPARRQGRVRALIVGDPIFDAGLGYRQLSGARDEAEQVAGWFEQAGREVGSIIDFQRQRDTRIHVRLTSADMRALLRDGQYDIVHFAGHGVFRADDPETSAWLLSDGELWSLEIRNTLAEHPAPPWLVYANACEAGMDGARLERKYQGNVFGLATAFINQGVAAYVAPLWPIDDLLAQHIALEFYRQLLCERATLGESLRRAKASARAMAYSGRNGGDNADETVWAGLGWASLVMYGDPTEELFQALAGGSHQSDAGVEASRTRDKPLSTVPADRAGSAPASRVKPGVLTPALLHAPDHVVSAWVRGPNWTDAGGDQRGQASPSDGEITLELIEDAGLRRWRVRRPGAGTRGAAEGSDGLPGSRIAAMLEDDRVRDLLPAKRGAMRVVGRWVLSGLKDGALGLVREYDREQVATEGLLIAGGGTSADLASAHGAPRRAAAKRALVIVHGTFSKTASPVDGLGPEFMAWARQQYGVVLGFDHWTLSATPEDNARLLADEIRAFDADLLGDGSLDIISHSRGGLVARSFCELLGHGGAVRNLVFIGTPNCGTDLANPKNWGSFADLLVNMTGIDGAETFGRMAGLLAQLTVGGMVNDVPGLLAQSPETASIAGSFLRRLQDPKLDRKKVRYSVVCSEFEPTALVPNLKKVAQAAAAASLDAGLDALFASANDLVVNTAHSWGIGCGPSDLTSLPKLLGDRVLLYSPPRTDFKPPTGVRTETALGVHHCNLFCQSRVRETIKEWLTAP